MKNIVNLNFNDNTLTGLAGFPFGEEIYKEQVKNIFDINKENVIIFQNKLKELQFLLFKVLQKNFLKNMEEIKL